MDYYNTLFILVGLLWIITLLFHNSITEYLFRFDIYNKNWSKKYLKFKVLFLSFAFIIISLTPYFLEYYINEKSIVVEKQETIQNTESKNVENLEKWSVSDNQTQSNSWEISNNTEKNLVNFSDEQIKDILLKLKENEKAQKEIQKNITWTLIQWDFKAEYIAPEDYAKNLDKILISINNKKYEIPWVYTKEIMEKYLNNVKNGACLATWDITDVVVNWKYYSSPSSWDCWMTGEDFWSFINFSPSWYYLLYSSYGYEWQRNRLVDVKTGKVFLNIYWKITMNTWTNDKSQFIYWQVWWIGNEWWLYITIKWNFPKTKKINDYDISSWYLDDNHIYVKNIREYSWDKNQLIIYDLKTLEEVFRKEI